jgi:hypothetical protein
VKAEPAPATPTKPSLGGAAAAPPVTPTVQKAEPTSVTPAKSLGGTATPATPPTSQKPSAVKVEGGRPALDALLKQMGVGLERVQNAALGVTDGSGGLNMDRMKIILQHFNKDPSGSRAELDSKLSLLLTSLGVL